MLTGLIDREFQRYEESDFSLLFLYFFSPFKMYQNILETFNMSLLYNTVYVFYILKVHFFIECILRLNKMYVMIDSLIKLDRKNIN